MEFQTTRDLVWSKITLYKDADFTIKDIQRLTALSRANVKYYLKAFVNSGHLAVKKGNKGELSRYTLVRCDEQAPKVNQKGKTFLSVNEAIWRTARILKSFSFDDLKASLFDLFQAKDSKVLEYLEYLCEGGYLAKTVEGDSNVRYRFVPARYFGPKPPVVRRVKQIYDPNQNKVVKEVLYG